jgi:hypothetical protein
MGAAKSANPDTQQTTKTQSPAISQKNGEGLCIFYLFTAQ